MHEEQQSFPWPFEPSPESLLGRYRVACDGCGREGTMVLWRGQDGKPHRHYEGFDIREQASGEMRTVCPSCGARSVNVTNTLL